MKTSELGDWVDSKVEQQPNQPNAIEILPRQNRVSADKAVMDDHFKPQSTPSTRPTPLRTLLRTLDDLLESPRALAGPTTGQRWT